MTSNVIQLWLYLRFSEHQNKMKWKHKGLRMQLFWNTWQDKGNGNKIPNRTEWDHRSLPPFLADGHPGTGHSHLRQQLHVYLASCFLNQWFLNNWVLSEAAFQLGFALCFLLQYSFTMELSTKRSTLHTGLDWTPHFCHVYGRLCGPLQRSKPHSGLIFAYIILLKMHNEILRWFLLSDHSRCLTI